MRITARIPLSLPNVNAKAIVSYNTYKKTTYDQYLAATILSASNRDEKVFNKYINEITGKGSLNKHFCNLIEEASKFNDNDIKKILENSMWPVTEIKEYNYLYHPVFDISIFNKKIITGKLLDKAESEIKNYLGINYDIIDIQFKEKTGAERKDTYDVEFNDNTISVKIENSFFKIPQKDFEKACSSEISRIDEYKGIIRDKASGDGWHILTNSVLNSLFNIGSSYYNSKGNFVAIMDKSLKEIEIVKVFGLYFYKETPKKYLEEYRNECEETVKYLIKNRKINEIKTKIIIDLIKICKDETKQGVINYILDRKNSKEIALIGLELIENGFEKGWSIKTINEIKMYTSNLNLLYKINSDVSYSNSELLRIDDDILRQEDLKRKKEYIELRENKICECDKIIGKITNSGIRDKIKELKATPEINSFKQDLNKMVGHKKGDIRIYSDEKLDQYYQKVLKLDDAFIKISKLVEENDKKSKS